MERTKIWIAERMKEFMKEKPLDKIRVTEICRAADIERPTFYYHFKDKYDLAAWIFSQTARDTDVLSLASAAEMLETARQNIMFYKRAYEDFSQNSLWQYMLEYFVELYVQKAKECLGNTQLSEHLTYSIRMFCYGGMGLSRDWLLSKSPIPATTLVHFIYSSMPANLQEIFFPQS